MSSRNLVVAFGGISPEHEVSVLSAMQVIASLKETDFNLIPLYVTKSGRWLTGEPLLEMENYQDLDSLKEQATHCTFSHDDLGKPVLLETEKNGLFSSPNSYSIYAVIPAFHGSEGENGSFQGACEMYNIPYAGSGVFASSLGMDKVKAKEICRTHDIPVVDGFDFFESEWEKDQQSVVNFAEKLGYPVILKPVTLGSSIGVAKAEDETELIHAVETAFRYDQNLMIEKAISPLIEINCSVLGTSDDLKTSVCERPLGQDETLSFEDKYQSDDGSQKGMASADREIPADISDELTQKIQSLSSQIFKLFRASGVARLDFLINADTKELFFNEINTIPGSFSFYLWEESGMNMRELMLNLIEIAVKRHQRKIGRIRSYDTNLLNEKAVKGIKGLKGRKANPQTINYYQLIFPKVMKSFFLQHKLLAVVALVILFAGCKQPETIVVDESPTAVAPSDTTEEDEFSTDAASFRKLVVGEYHTIPTLDPLFAENASSMRAVQLVFEGLVRLDADGSVISGLAKSWEVSEDSLTYTFSLQEDIYYQDSDIFSTGTGRKMTSKDVKFVFERMAQAGIPPKAAHLFMGIRGFEPYFQEQREVYLPSNRKLEGVSGIQTPNDTTVVFDLVNQDPEFLQKLATPLAVIYPQEAVGSTVESFSPVGTGPFQFSSRDADTSLVFSKFQNYYAASEIQLNRVDIISSRNESKLFQAMSRNEIYVMPQLGPQTLPVVLRGDGSLQGSYSERYNLSKNSGFYEYIMHFNPEANLSTENAQTISTLAKKTNDYFSQFPNALVTPSAGSDSTSISSDLSTDQVFTAYFEDPFVKTYLGALAKVLDQNGVELQMAEIRTPSRNTGLFFTQHYPFIPDKKWDDYQELFSFKVSQTSLQRKEISGLDYNKYPWWFDLRGVTLPAPENLN